MQQFPSLNYLLNNTLYVLYINFISFWLFIYSLHKESKNPKFGFWMQK